MHDLLEAIHQSGVTYDEDGREFAVSPTSIPRESGLELSRLVREENAHWTLEVGCAFGVSSLHFCQSLSQNGGGLHTAIDPFQKLSFHNIGLANIQRAGYKQLFRFFESPSHEVLPMLTAAQERFNIVFIDGNHLFDYAFVDFFYADKLIGVGGLVILDDIWMESVQQLVRFITTNLSYQIVQPKESSNLCIVRKCGEDMRVWDFHHRF